MNPHVVKRLLWTHGLPFVGACIIVMQLAWWLPTHVHADTPYDVDVYQAAARHAAAGEQVYGRQTRVRIDDVPTGFFYPPTALALVMPAARMSTTAWRYTCFLLALASFWALAAALVKLGTGAVDPRKTLALGALMSIFPPMQQSLNVGNFDLLVIAACAWGLAAPRFAPMLLVIATSIKIYPVFALLALFPREDLDGIEGWAFRHYTAGFALTVAGLAGLVLGSPHYIHEWITLGLPSLSTPVLHFGNWSLSTILVHSALTAEVANTPGVVRVVLSAAPLLAAFIAAAYTRKQPPAVSAVAALIAGTWFTSICWWWRILPLLTIAAAVWYRRRRT